LLKWVSLEKKPFLYKEQNEEAKQKFLTALKKVTATSGVYLEEGGIRQDSLREFGWAPCGEPSGGRRTGTRQRRLNLIAALHDHTVKAPLIYEGVMHPELFNTYLREQLLPQLMPGALLIMDKASFHKSTATSNLIKEKGVQLWFLPPYSPELNPLNRV
jgi:DDE superfamily endonuclease